MTGFAVMVLGVTLGGVFGIAGTAASTAMVSLFAVVLGLGAGVGASLYGARPAATDIDFFEAMRRPDGETLFDQAEARAATAAARRNAD